MEMSSTWRIKRLLLTGLFIVAPFSLTFILLAWFVALVDGALAPLTSFIGYRIPGLGLLVAFAMMLLAGILGSNIAGQQLLDFLDELFLKIPVFNWIYRTVKQLSEAFSPGAKSHFRGVVLIEYPRPKVYSLGFVTNELVLERGSMRREMLSVYIPTNHMYIGDYVLVPAEGVIRTKITQQEGVQAAISAGASLPAEIKVPYNKE